MSLTGGLTCLAFLVASASGAEESTPHPLRPVVEFARDSYQRFDSQVEDYTATLVKRERVDGGLRGRQFIFLKLRHEQARDGQVVTPFSVYLKFLAPARLAGREVVYVRGRHRDRLIARNGGPQFPFITTTVVPDSPLAMKGNRYPATEIGIEHLMKECLAKGTEDLKHGECEVEYFRGVKLNGRTCTAVQVTHPVRREYFCYHVAEIFIDDQLRLPIRYAAYDWPEQEGGPPKLVEEYTYLNLKFNVGLTDRDFDHRNPDYGFRKDFVP